MQESLKAIEIDPYYWIGHMARGLVLAHQGMAEEAIAACVKARELNPCVEATAFLAHVYGVVGRREAAESILDEMKELSRSTYLPPFWFALVYCSLGETGQALEWLERAVEERDPTVSMLKADPTFRVLRADPRYQALLQRLRLAP